MKTDFDRPAYLTNFLDPGRVRLFFSPTGRLRLTMEDRVSYLSVKLLRTFPLTRADIYISVRDRLDPAEPEIGLIADLAHLESGSYAAAREALQHHYFIPRIKAIQAISDEFGFLYWKVETDRGPCTFPMRDAHDSVREVAERRLFLTDADGAHFEIPDLEALDPRSRELIRSTVHV